jgi:hypothetical protein
MQWFVYSNGVGKNHLFVQARTVASSQKRLSRWSKLRNMNIIDVEFESVSYDTFSEASMKYTKFTMIDGSI